MVVRISVCLLSDRCAGISEATRDVGEGRGGGEGGKTRSDADKQRTRSRV